MAELPILTVAVEGGFYGLDRNPSAPIRIYKDRRVQDDIVTAKLGIKWRARMTRNEFRMAKRYARQGRLEGRA